MYNKKIKNKMAAFAVYDFFFQMSLIGLVLIGLMVLLKEHSATNCLYSMFVSAIGGGLSAYFDIGKVKKGTIELEKPMDTDRRDFLISMLAIIGYFAGMSVCFYTLGMW